MSDYSPHLNPLNDQGEDPDVAIIRRQISGLLARAPESPAGLCIIRTCLDVAELLADKNRKYGNSALAPLRVFSKASLEEQINVRMDDKLSRIMSAQPDDMEEPELDLLGYLVLKRVHHMLTHRGVK